MTRWGFGSVNRSAQADFEMVLEKLCMAPGRFLHTWEALLKWMTSRLHTVAACARCPPAGGVRPSSKKREKSNAAPGNSTRFDENRVKVL